MIIKESKLFRIIIVEAYDGCIPISVYMVQRKQERSFLPDKWVNIKGYKSLKKALIL